MDPAILEDLVQQGRLPTFKRLMREGDFRPLATTMPPQSPVAWSTFITGADAGTHGIFDFIHRDKNSLLPYFSISKSESPEPLIHIGDWVVPRPGGGVRLLRQGTAFWEILDEKGIPVTIIRAPANFPPVNCGARQLSGMGTPDLLGTYGTFSFYTDRKPDPGREISGGKILHVENSNNKIRARLLGPQNPFRKSSSSSHVPFEIWLDPQNPVVKITVQDHQIILQEGEWSDWVRVDFQFIPFLQSVSGICRFFLKEVRPDFKLYVTPINIDPSSPVMPLSTPEEFSDELSREIGLFYTQGIPEDTDALSEDMLTDSEFLKQASIVFEEELRMLDYALERFQSGLLFFYIGQVDQFSHVFWRSRSPEDTLSDSTGSNSAVIQQVYLEMDRIVAKTLRRVDEQTTLIVLSDHGFAAYNRSFNLNTWLKREGYTVVKDDREGGLLQNVDWARTRAYGLGFNGLYLNLKGRESTGIVFSGVEEERVLAEIKDKLLAFRDPGNGEKVIANVYRSRDIYDGPYAEEAPDLIIGYNRGYRASSDSVLGKFPKLLLEENTEKWNGDHLIDAQLVPGVILSNKKIRLQSPSLHDLAPTVLAEFGIEKSECMKGTDLFQ